MYSIRKYNLNKFINKTLVYNLNEIESLSLMSKCNLGGICTNSTLGWWGGYLNTNCNKKIFYPNKNLNNDWPCDILTSDMTIVSV
jgi:beta-lactamase class D